MYEQNTLFTAADHNAITHMYIQAYINQPASQLFDFIDTHPVGLIIDSDEDSDTNGGTMSCSIHEDRSFESSSLESQITVDEEESNVSCSSPKPPSFSDISTEYLQSDTGRGIHDFYLSYSKNYLFYCNFIK